MTNNKFLSGLQQEANWKQTENGADALASTHSKLLDLFGTIGALRTRSATEIVSKFLDAYAEDALLALKMLFYARDIRGGLGERRVFTTVLHAMATRAPEVIELNFANIAEFGRYDDFYCLVDTSLEKKAFAFLLDQFNKDLYGVATGAASISLLGKWLKSANGSSKQTCYLGCKTAKAFGLSVKQYRKDLTLLRNKIRIVEAQMSAQKWDAIKFEAVPSKAMTNYRTAFYRHQETRFEQYIADVKKGVKKINSSTLYPYDLVQQYGVRNLIYSRRYSAQVEVDSTVEAQWASLPNYIEGEHNIMVMCDTSGSMMGRPMDTSLGLGIYFAQHNHGPYHNKLMAFSSKPCYITLNEGATLLDCLLKAYTGDCSNTDIEAAFELILQVAVDNKLEQQDLPTALVIISDMEFDNAIYGTTRATYSTIMKQKFAEHGYQLPKIVYWNVDARQDTFHATQEDTDIQFISGQSASAFQSLLRGSGCTAYELMVQTITDPRYDCVVLERPDSDEEEEEEEEEPDGMIDALADLTPANEALDYYVDACEKNGL